MVGVDVTMVAIIPLVTTAVKVSINVRSGVGNWEHDLTPFLRSVTDICAHNHLPERGGTVQ